MKINSPAFSKLIFAVLITLFALLSVHKFIHPIIIKTTPLTNYKSEQGFASTAKLPPKLIEYAIKFPGKIEIYEDNARLFEAIHYHGYIRELGYGRANIYNNETLYFSASDNSNPSSNGRRYTYKHPVYVRFRHLLVLGALILFFGFRLKLTGIKGLLTSLTGFSLNLIVTLKSIIPAKVFAAIFLLSALLGIALTVHKTKVQIMPAEYILDEIVQEPIADPGFNYVTSFSKPRFQIPQSQWYRYDMFEDGVKLNAAHTDHNSIRHDGLGRWSFHINGLVFFSSSDNTPPTSNNRVYSIKGPLLISWTGPIILFIASGFALLMGGKNLRQSLTAIISALGHKLPFTLIHIGVIITFITILLDISIESISVFDFGKKAFNFQIFGFYMLIYLFGYYCLIGESFQKHLNSKVFRGLHFITLLVVALPTAVSVAYLGVTLETMSLGSVPWNDASAHHEGVYDFLQNNIFNDWSGRRPLSVILNSDKFLLAGGNIRFIPMAAILISLFAVYLAFLRLSKIIPAAIAFLFVVVIFPNLITHSPQMLSSNSGLTFSCLALVLLLGACHARRLKLAILGATLMSLALFIRPGALLVLPMIGLLGYFILDPGKRFRNWIRWTVGGALACAFGLIVSLGALNALGLEGSSSLNSNANHTLYGFVNNSDWTEIYKVFPDFDDMSLEEQKTLVRKEVVQTLKNKPQLAIKEFGENTQIFVNSFFDFVDFDCKIYNSMCYHNQGKTQKIVLIAMAIVVIGAILGDGISLLITFILIGAFASAGIVYGDGGVRSFGPIAPVVALTVSYSVFLCYKLFLFLKLKILNSGLITKALRVRLASLSEGKGA